MVGTLHCRRLDSSAVDAYNAFISAHRAFLDANNIVLKRHFEREEGELADRAYDRHNTSAANFHAGGDDFRSEEECRQLVSLAKLASHMAGSDLLMLADAFSSPPRRGQCEPSRWSEEEPQAIGPTGGQGAVLANAQIDPPVKAAVLATDGSTPAPGEATGTKPPEPAVSTMGAPPAPATGATQADALKAAIAALEAATAALRMAAPAAAESAPADRLAAAAPPATGPGTAPVVASAAEK
jgi:hypothetical protein